MKKKEDLLFKKNSISPQLGEPLKLNKSTKNSKNYNQEKSKPIFPLFYFFLDLFLDKLIYPEKFFCLPKSYFTVYNFMCQIYDISSHIKLFKQFNLLNKIVREKLFKDEKVSSLKIPCTKINVCDKNIIEKLNKDLKNKNTLVFSDILI